jgi:signal transduction histidine kinase/ligand-binding sensor domain-containing protein
VLRTLLPPHMRAFIHRYCCILLMALALTARAQEPAYVHYTTLDGLAGSSVYSAFQDSKGFVWFATSKGVSRFDGRVFRTYTTSDGLSDNEVFEVHEDSQGRIWFLTLNGRPSFLLGDSLYNGTNTALLRGAQSSDLLSSFLELPDGRVVIGSQAPELIVVAQGRSRVVPLTKVQRSLEKRYLFGPKGGPLLRQLADGALEVRCSGIIDRVVDHQVTSTRVLDVWDSDPYTLLKSYTGLQYRRRPEGLCSLDAGEQTTLLVPAEQLPPLQQITVISVDSANGYWVCGRAGGALLLAPSHTDSTLTRRTFLPRNTVNSVFTDREGTVWFCTDGAGVYALTRACAAMRNHRVDEAGGEVAIHTLLSAGIGRTWLGCANGTVVRSGGGTDHTLHLALPPGKGKRVLGLAPGPPGHIWCATDAAMVLVEENTGATKVLGADSIGDLTACKRLVTSPDGQLFVHSTHVLFTVPTAPPWRFHRVRLPLPEARISGVGFGADGALYVYTAKGFFCVRGQQAQRLDSTDQRLLVAMAEMLALDDTTLLLATAGEGLLFWRRGRVAAQVTAANGLPSDRCSSVFPYQGAIWVGTDRGLCKLVLHASGWQVARTWSVGQGLLSNNVLDITCADGVVHAATDLGLATFPIDAPITTIGTPITYLLTGAHGDVPVRELAWAPPSYAEASLHIAYTSPVFDAVEQLEFRYALDRGSPTTTPERLVQFAGIAPGDHVFTVQSRRPGGAWGPLATLTFTVLPPFWRSSWFLAACWFAGALALLFLVSYLLRRQRRGFAERLRQEQALAHERMRIASDLHDDMGGDVVHLMLLAQQIEQQPNSAQALVTAMADRARGMRKHMDEVIWGLDGRHDSVDSLLAAIRAHAEELAVTSGLMVSVDFPADQASLPLTTSQRRQFWLAYKEVMTNIQRHARATSVTLKGSYTAATFRLEVQDNGVGFTVDPLVDKGHGSRNMRKRMSDLGGEFQVETEHGKGTRVTLSMPIG